MTCGQGELIVGHLLCSVHLLSHFALGVLLTDDRDLLRVLFYDLCGLSSSVLCGEETRLVRNHNTYGSLDVSA